MTAGGRLRRLLRMGSAELGFRSRTGVQRLADRARLAVAPPAPHEAGLHRRLSPPERSAPWYTDALVDARRRAERGDLPDAGSALRVHLAVRGAPPLPGRPDGRLARLSAMVAADPGLEARIVARAEGICAGRYDLLGHRGLDAGRGPEGGPDWHRDAVSGRRAPLVSWSRVPYLDASLVGDHKVIWELSRHQHWLDLALAYRFSGRARYADRLALEAATWLASSPPKLGIHWASMLECALRCLAWLRALPFVLDAPELDDALVARLIGSLDRQIRHVRSHLSVYFSPNTHLLGEALALLVAGLRLPELASAAEWRAAGLAELERGAARQILADGLHAERSATYHRYATDFYLEAVAALVDAGPAVADVDARALEPALHRLLDALAALTLPDGSLPLLGDDDGGEALPLDGEGPSDARPTLGAGAVWLARRDPGAAADLREAAGNGSPPARAALLFEPAAMPAKDDAEAVRASPAPCSSRPFEEGGYVVIRRGRGRRGDVAIVDVGPLGDDGRAGGSAGHGHADALSLFVVRRGVPRVIDPGTYSYTVEPTWREALRATTAHATVALHGRSSSEPAGPFRWATHAGVTRHACHRTGPVTFVDASHDGYRRIDPPLDHRRVVVHGAGPGLFVLDLVVPAQGFPIAASLGRAVQVDVTWPLGLLPGEEPPAAVEGGFTWGRGPSAFGLLGAPLAGATGPLAPASLLGGPPGPGWASPRYGSLRRGAALRYSGRVVPPAGWWWWLGPASLARKARLISLPIEPGPQAQDDEAAGPARAACALGDGAKTVVVAWSAGGARSGRVAGVPVEVEGRLTVACLDRAGTLLARHVVA